MRSAIPAPQGLYDPEHEKDACGVAFVAQLSGEPSRTRSSAGHHRARQPRAPRRLRAPSRTPATAPASSSRSRTTSSAPSSPRGRRRCPPRRSYAVGIAFLPDRRRGARAGASRPSSDRRRGGPRGRSAGATCRSTRPASAPTALSVMPRLRQLFVALRRRSASWAWRSSGWPSACASAPSTRPTSTSRRCRSRTIVYKGMLTTGQVSTVLPRPHRPALHPRARPRALALLDQHVPVWPLAHPYRLIAHNGEINTVKGNRNWMRAREAQIQPAT